MSFLNFMSTPIGRVVRVLMGVGLFAVGALIGGPAGTGLQVFAFLPALTGVFGICPINPLVGRPIRCDEACRTGSPRG